MTTRYNYKWVAPEKKSDPIKRDYELIKIIEPVSFNDDGKTIKEYVEREEYVCHESLWSDFIKSFDLGSVSEQVINHLTKGTPLVTGHVLPDGDYTPESLLKGAAVKREMESKGITIDMLVAAFKEAQSQSEPVKESEVAQ